MRAMKLGVLAVWMVACTGSGGGEAGGPGADAAVPSGNDGAQPPPVKPADLTENEKAF